MKTTLLMDQFLREQLAIEVNNNVSIATLMDIEKYIHNVFKGPIFSPELKTFTDFCVSQLREHECIYVCKFKSMYVAVDSLNKLRQGTSIVKADTLLNEQCMT